MSWNSLYARTFCHLLLERIFGLMKRMINFAPGLNAFRIIYARIIWLNWNIETCDPISDVYLLSKVNSKIVRHRGCPLQAHNNLFHRSYSNLYVICLPSALHLIPAPVGLYINGNLFIKLYIYDDKLSFTHPLLLERLHCESTSKINLEYYQLERLDFVYKIQLNFVIETTFVPLDRIWSSLINILIRKLPLKVRKI